MKKVVLVEVKTAITALVVGRAGKPKGAGRVQPFLMQHSVTANPNPANGGPLPARAYAVVPPATLVIVPTVPRIVIVIIVVMMVVMMVVIIVVMMVVMMVMLVMMVMIIANELHVWVGMATRRVGDPQKRSGIGNGIKQFAK
jgi:hypothetical protein